MKASLNILYFLLFVFLNTGIVVAQQTRLELAEKYFDQFAYNTAIELYEGAIKKGKDSWKNYAKLADCYYNISQPAMAMRYYEIAIGKNNKIDAIYLLKYALSLQSAGRSRDSVLIAYQEYYSRMGIQEQIGLRTINDSHISPENLTSINSSYSDFGTFIYNDTLYFASARENPVKPKRFNKRLYKWNLQPFLDIYTAKVNRKSDSLPFVLIPSDSSGIGVNTMAHESSVAITKDGQTMYYSGGMVNQKGEMRYDKWGNSHLKLHRASRIDDRWIETTEDRNALKSLELKHYSVSSPALSPDNKRLYFVSCAPFPDAKGQTDIYYVDIDEDGSLGKVTNVPGINTYGREGFPYLASDGSLYFSSDGIYDNLLSMGLLDIYKVEDIDMVISKTKKPEIIHLKSPFNSDKDDFAFFIDENSEDESCEFYAYFSSNRKFMGAKGDDDLYRTKLKKFKTVSGVVTNAKTLDPITDANVHLINSDGVVLKSVKVDEKAGYSFEVECDQFYRLRASKANFYDDLIELDTANSDQTVSLQLNPYPCEFSGRIGFELDSDQINSAAAENLTPILELLLTNPGIKVRIEAHTDLRGSAEYNLDLSQRRAQNTRQHLINEGVKAEQIISAIGLGEKCPLISEEEIKLLPPDQQEIKNALNRRSRFILSICEDETEVCADSVQKK